MEGPIAGGTLAGAARHRGARFPLPFGARGALGADVGGVFGEGEVRVAGVASVAAKRREVEREVSCRMIEKRDKNQLPGIQWSL